VTKAQPVEQSLYAAQMEIPGIPVIPGKVLSVPPGQIPSGHTVLSAGGRDVDEEQLVSVKAPSSPYTKPLHAPDVAPPACKHIRIRGLAYSDFGSDCMGLYSYAGTADHKMPYYKLVLPCKCLPASFFLLGLTCPLFRQSARSTYFGNHSTRCGSLAPT
jgi:hypothetical protein